MSRRVTTMSVGAVLLVVLGVFGAKLPVPYAALGPGPTVDTLGQVDGKQIIALDGRQASATAGHLNLTTVSVQDHLDLITALRGWIEGDISVVPREEVFPPDKTEDQVDAENTQQFAESQSNAVQAALRELKYPEKVVVQGLSGDGSASKGRLDVRDVLTTLDGTAVTDLDQLGKQLTALAPGRMVTVGYERDHKPGTTTVTLQKAEKREGGALGVLVGMEPIADFDVSIDVGEQIGGPSAGLMFALGIIEKVGTTELTGGRFIAGTGTIDPAGAVGPIGGIPLKMIAAKDKGATVFLVPADNCAEAKKTAPAGLQLIKVDSLHDALGDLTTLRSGGTPGGC